MNYKMKKLDGPWPSALILAIFSAVTLGQFWPALRGTASLSKLQQLAEWDSLFAAQRTGQSMLMDPSLVYLMLPYYWLKANLIKIGQVPLWNPYSGLGCPLAADPQALAFSPLHLPLLLNPQLAGYSQVLVLEILLLGGSTYGLARSVGLSRIASTFALVAIAFCPYERWYLELLGNGFCFVPLVFWLILRLDQPPAATRSNLNSSSSSSSNLNSTTITNSITPGKIWITGLGCALMVLSAHPELSFFSIGMASLALVAKVIADKLIFAKDKALRWQALAALLAAGAIAFLIAAPMLVPFLEYLRQSDSYKFGSGAPAVVRWQTWFFNLLQPGFGGASPTLGPCAIILLPLALQPRKNRTLISVLFALLIFGLLITGKIFPFDFLLGRPPLSYLVVNYAFPSILLITAILAACGLDAALDSIKKEGEDDLASGEKVPSFDRPQIGKMALIASLIMALLVVLFPLAAKYLAPLLPAANFDLCLPSFAFNRNDILRYSIYALLTAGAVVAVKLKPVRKSGIFLTLAVILGQSAEITTAAKSLPRRPAFAYNEKIIVPELYKNTANGQSRFIATGNHLFRPNSNVVFALSDLRTHNPLFPRRYLAFIKACGAHLDQFNQEFDSPLSPLLGLASVRAVLSHNPVVSNSELEANQQTPLPAMGVTVEPGTLSATFSPLVVDAAKQAIFGKLAFNVSKGNSADLSYNFALYEIAPREKITDKTFPAKPGAAIWCSDLRPLAADTDQPRFVTIPTPMLDSGKEVMVGLQVYNKVTETWLSPDGNRQNSSKLKTPFIFGTIKLQAKSVAQKEDGTYKLVFESPDHLRIYQNQNVTPRAFAVHKKQNVKTQEEALTAIQSKDFKPAEVVILEDAVNLQNKTAAEGSTALDTSDLSADKVVIKSINADKITIDTELKSPGYVVLNDIYYPGWQARVDDKEAHIYAANYIMRAVAVGAGSHQIVFSFQPLSFTIGLFMCGAGLLIGLLIGLLSVIRALMPASGKEKRSA